MDVDSLRDHFQLRGLILHGTRSHHDVEPAGLDDLFHLEIEKRKFVRSNGELDCLTLARRERDALEIFQLHDWTRYRAYEIVNVQLDDLVSRALAGVSDSHADFRLVGRSDLRGTHFQI